MLKKTERNIEISTADKQNKKTSNHKHVRAKIISWASISSSKYHVDIVGKDIEEHRKIKGWTAKKKRKLRTTITKASPKKGNTKATKHVSSKIISWASISSSKHHADIVGKDIEGQRKANSWRAKQRKFRSRLAKLIRNCECKIHKKSAQITRWASTSSSKYKFDKVEDDIEEHRKSNGWAAKERTIRTRLTKASPRERNTKATGQQAKQQLETGKVKLSSKTGMQKTPNRSDPK